ncbi:putative oxidoreductase YdgJ [Maioricimonas rarisocia]|uniref:Putative oxidoreductase YdgJ n=1 Tax=Maioricimonas rarisocia TaxID=2528026 RepID=A0A517Z5Z0_9PLAN|nr:Gfo/Idh/MocA family oxidoreductase [Maioricimonas rarisocia]QDU37912.1 putative oxidoreductase YdgJ [Maioricimonas rarisocia]
MAEKYRVGIIGRTDRGNYGHGLDSVWREIDRAQVIAVADDDERGRWSARSRTGAERAYSDYREMLEQEQLDIVAVAPRWMNEHKDMMLAAAEHGCHIYTEKPFCRDLTEADEIVAACEMRHLKLAIAHQTRWTPTLDVVKREISKGLIGRVLEIRGRGKEDARRGGGEDLWVLGSHVLDLMRVFGGDPQTCYATVLENGEPVTGSHVREGNEGIGPLAGDAINAMYTLPEGATGYFGSHRGTAGDPSRFGIQVFGSEGVVEFLTGHLAPCHVLRDSSWSPGRSRKEWVPISSNGVGKPETLPRTGLHGGNVLAVNDLIDCIGNPEQQPKCSMYDARWTVEMIAGVFESHRTGGPVTLPLKQRENPLTLL